ncbi:MAG: hypothetical protein AAFW46_11915, partial [Pseudomonadota bacterium]
MGAQKPSPAPWSVKGIPPETRELAKTIAHGEGLTLGAWLSQRIAECAAGAEAEAAPADAPARPAPAMVSGMLDALATNLARIEARDRERVEALNAAIAALGARLDQVASRVETEAPHGGPVRDAAPANRELTQARPEETFWATDKPRAVDFQEEEGPFREEEGPAEDAGSDASPVAATHAERPEASAMEDPWSDDPRDPAAWSRPETAWGDAAWSDSTGAPPTGEALGDTDLSPRPKAAATPETGLERMADRAPSCRAPSWTEDAEPLSTAPVLGFDPFDLDAPAEDALAKDASGRAAESDPSGETLAEPRGERPDEIQTEIQEEIEAETRSRSRASIRARFVASASSIPLT